MSSSAEFDFEMGIDRQSGDTSDEAIEDNHILDECSSIEDEVPPNKKPKTSSLQGTKFAATFNLSKDENQAKWRFLHLRETCELQLSNTALTYVVAGLEKGDQGHWHAQAYLELPPRKKKTCAGVRKSFPDFNPHCEIAVTCPNTNKTYCLKGGHDLHFEIGTARSFTKEGPGAREKMDWAAQYALAKKDVTACAPRLQITCYSNLQKINFAATNATKDVTDYKNYFLYGDTGTGKTRLMHTMAGELSPDYPAYSKDAQTKWFDGINEQHKVVMIDEIERNASFMGHLLKKLCDRYPVRVEIKGAGCVIRPTSVLMTSNYTIDEIFKGDDQLIAALKRRIRIIHVQNFNEALGMWKSATIMTPAQGAEAPLPTSAVAGFNAT